MNIVSALGYVVVRGPLEAWQRFGPEILGLQPAPSADPDTLLFKTDSRSWRLAIEAGEPAGPQSLVALGLEVRSAERLEALADTLRSRGIEVHEDPDLAERRRVRGLIVFRDATGNTLEAYWGPSVDKTGFTSPRGVTFVAGETAAGEIGIGHTFLLAEDVARAAAFYTEHLGFKLSDTIAFGPQPAHFLHCNPRHHSIAFAALPGAPASGLGHLMLEVTTLEAVGRALDAVQEQEMPIPLSIGEHSNDRMTSFYVRTPSGFDIEYGYNGRVIDDRDWTVSHYESPSNWGHRFTAVPGPATD
ncbi:VOC family protein [Embleya hyalina]|uniref:Putative 2,3-dihydroxybiphenyl 1,2-dioxygenase n=1 Tax=Embleya hyalina TaxID=516124 RepID=A0A401YT75_9ACTN|nr:VOC family protein [Embleya hyalina]GCD97776.1 putative 2,3-dihydroxybiphenyl 1,2-dioxygenase [Embleya hyalina]